MSKLDPIQVMRMHAELWREVKALRIELRPLEAALYHLEATICDEFRHDFVYREINTRCGTVAVLEKSPL